MVRRLFCFFPLPCLGQAFIVSRHCLLVGSDWTTAVLQGPALPFGNWGEIKHWLNNQSTANKWTQVELYGMEAMLQNCLTASSASCWILACM